LGFHFLTLEWRENSSVILRADIETLQGKELERPDISAATRDLIASLRALTKIRDENGPQAVGALLVSNTEGPEVILALTRLAQASGVFVHGEIPVVPLLESIDALRNGPEIIETICLARGLQRGAAPSMQRVQVMLGYSDAAKDGGRLQADQAIRHAQTQIAEKCAEFGVVPYLFHGRGGTPARGEASIAESFADLAPVMSRGILKQTEQGEVIANRYGIRSLPRIRSTRGWSALCNMHKSPSSATKKKPP
jgi:phosphoenolpyruvate carboxylase